MEMSGTHVDTRLGLRRDSWAGDVLGVQVIKAGEAEASGGGVASGRALGTRHSADARARVHGALSHCPLQRMRTDSEQWHEDQGLEMPRPPSLQNPVTERDPTPSSGLSVRVPPDASILCTLF